MTARKGHWGESISDICYSRGKYSYEPHGGGHDNGWEESRSKGLIKFFVKFYFRLRRTHHQDCGAVQ